MFVSRALGNLNLLEKSRAPIQGFDMCLSFIHLICPSYFFGVCRNRLNDREKLKISFQKLKVGNY